MRYLIALLLAISFSVNAETLHGRVIGVSDGDTITVLDNSKAQFKIRLQGIDALKRRRRSAHGQSPR